MGSGPSAPTCATRCWAGEYCDDLYLDGMAHASRRPLPSTPGARVLDIDPSAALALPGCWPSLTADDGPTQGGPPPAGLGRDDRQGDITRCVGDASAWWWRKMRPCSSRPRSW